MLRLAVDQQMCSYASCSINAPRCSDHNLASNMYLLCQWVINSEGVQHQLTVVTKFGVA